MDSANLLEVLVLRDASDRSASIEELLRRSGYIVTRFYMDSPGGFRSVVASSSWSAIIFDNCQPEYDLPSVIKVLRESGQDIPFIIVSEALEGQAAAAAMKLGADDYVNKSNLARLVPALEREVREAQWRRAQCGSAESLRDSEQRLRLALEGSYTGVWQWDLATNEVDWSPECYRMLGYQPPIGNLETVLALVHPDDREPGMKVAMKALQEGTSFRTEFRMLLPSGEVRWLANLAQGKYDAQGRPLRLIGTMRDITAKKRAADKLTDANVDLERFTAYYQAILGRLHTIREEERAHLAREIHDELGQALTSLKFGAYGIQRDLERNDSPAAISRVHQWVAGIDEMIQSIRDIASDLRPPLLDHLGLAAALDWQSSRLQRQEGLEIRVSLPASEPDLTEVQKITLFRIAQESLTNVMRHSGSKSASLSLQAGDDIVLTISDQGSGIATSGSEGRSLGIAGMRERARLIGAVFTIQGTPGLGTTVQVTIPANPSRESPHEVRNETKSTAGR